MNFRRDVMGRDTTSMPATPNPGTDTPHAAPRLPVRVLLAEDDPAEARLIMESLGGATRERFSITQTARLDDTVARLARSQFDVVLLDLGLPDSIGLDAVMAVRRHAPHVPIIVLAGVADDQLAKGAMQEGAQDYLEKSEVDAQALSRAIRYAIDRQAAALALHDSQMLLQSLYDSAPLMMGMVELDGDDIVHISDNSATASFFGLRPDMMRNRRASQLGLSRKDLDEWIGRYEKSLRTGRPASFEYAHERPNGTRWLSVTVRPIDHMAGERPRFCYVAQDITDTKHADEQLAFAALDMAATNAELAEARDRAEEISRLKSDFLATMSHEIRTPLNGVVGMTALLMDTDLTSEQRGYAETAKNAGETLLGVINDILDFSKIEAGKLELEIIDFDLRAALEEVLDLFAEHAQRKGLELTGLVHAIVPTTLQGDPGRLRQILTNLVGNAIKFTEKGEVVVQVTVADDREGSEEREASRVRREGTAADLSDTPDVSRLTPHGSRDASHENPSQGEVLIRFEVADTGLGITPEAREKLFQSFTQAEGSISRRFGGTGLGLMISKRLSERMGGQIGVDSEPGKGSRFWFTARLGKRADTIEAGSASRQDLHGLRVCIVDDCASNRMLLEQHATAWGMVCETVVDGPRALDLLRAAASRGVPFDAALLDMSMPGVTGLDLALAITADESLAATKLVLLTSHGQRGDAKVAREAGLAAYLTKPVREARLYECLARVTGRGTEAGVQPSESKSSLITAHSLLETEIRAGAKILLSDDNIMNQTVGVSMLGKLGYRADVVSNGRDAVEALTRSHYDLVFMDCHMPVMDGFEATAEIRRREALGEREEASQANPPDTPYALRLTPHVPIIALTASALTTDRATCFAAGMDDFLPKPLTMKALAVILEKWRPGTTKNREAPRGPRTSHRAPRDASEAREASKEREESESSTRPEARGPLHEVRAAREEPCDISRALARVDGDRELFFKLASMMMTQGPKGLAEIAEALGRKDAQEVARLAHRLKGSVTQLSAARLIEVARQLERLGEAGDLNGVRETLPALEQEMSALVEFLRAWMERYQPA